MQLVTSISLATSGSRRTDGDGNVVAERAAISSDWSVDMAAPSGLLDVDDESLVLGSLGVRIADERRQRVDQIPLLGQANEPPMVRQAHRVHLASAAVERCDARRHQRDRFQAAAFAADLYPVAVGDALLLGQLDADLDELLRLDDGRRQHVL